MENIAENIRFARERIRAAGQKYGRPADSVTLVAVSKSQPVESIRRAVTAGQRDFGESYLQEALPKINEFKSENLTWHFIGPVQSNKTATVAGNFDWVHTLDREKIARRISEARSPDLMPLNACIQVNISGETSKSGMAPAEVREFARYVKALPGLSLRGLMVIPAPTRDFEGQRRVFRRAYSLMKELNAGGLDLDTLSMGMSDDYVAAIAEGATLVRIGTAIFGSRQT